MGIQQQDPEYLRAKYAFIRDLIQFHESRGTGLQCDPKINGKEVDLYLLYQIVTSHGGWEKINLRNEWDKLLEHFKLPRSTNGGLAIKQIYLRYLELYEKIHYLGEDVDTKEEAEDEYMEDFRGRRRYPNKLVSGHHGHHSSSSSHHHHHPPKEITDHNRSQLGLSSRILECSDYEGLLLSLQSPLPNEQDMAISVCTLLSNETKHVLRFSKSPSILNMLLAHAGIYQDCGMRLLMQETYKNAREMDYAEFWDEVLHQPDARQLLCECFVKRVNTSLGLTDDESMIISQIQEIEDGDLPEEEKHAVGTALRLKLARLRESRVELPGGDDEEPCASTSSNQAPLPLPSKEEPVEEKMETETSEQCISSPKKEEEDGEAPPNGLVCNGIPAAAADDEVQECVEISSGNSNTNIVKDDKVEEAGLEPEEKPEPVFGLCCSICPCQRTESIATEAGAESSSAFPGVEFSIQRPKSKMGQVIVDEAGDGPTNSLPFTLSRAHQGGDKVGQRICQIAHILRNLSFEQDNALIMAKSPTLMRFLLVAAHSSFGSLAQASFDIIGNISSYIRLEEPLRDPLSSLFLTLVTSGVFSTDRFKILRSLESLRELTRVEGNEGIIARYIESRVYRRMCDLLTLSDIMLLIYTLECILSMTGLGEAVCDEIVRVQGSVATLVSLVTVEAQSYGPKGCILMRVVETVTGAATTAPGPSSSSSSTSSAAVPSSSSSTTVVSMTPSSTNHTLSSVQAIPQSTMIAMSQPHHTVVQPVPQAQHLLQQVLQQPPNPVYAPSAGGSTTPTRPSPSSSPGLKIVTGTTTVVPPVAPGQIGLQPILPSQQPAPMKSVATIRAHLLNPTNGNPNGSNQVFSNPASSTNLINHLNASNPALPPQPQQYLPGQHSQVVGAVALHQQQPTSALPKPSSALPSPLNRVQFVNNTGGASNDSIVAPPPPPGATLVVHQQHKTVSLPNSASPTTVVVPVSTPGAAVNGAPSSCLMTGTLPQISNHSLNQHHVVTPSISLVTPRGTLSEEAWAIAWLKGTFESATGTSIEQGEIYRMYSAARKNPNVVLSLEQFVQCVKCAYGANVGPVIKQFGGGTSLPFFEGIKPKLSIRAVAVGSGAAGSTAIKVMGHGGNAIVTPTTATNPPAQVPVPSVPVPIAVPPPPAALPVVQTLPPPPPPPPTVIPVMTPVISQDGGESNALAESTLINTNCTTGNHSGSTNNNNAAGATIPVSVHIPSREAKPSLSPILQATLSQPPKAKNNTTTCGAAPLTTVATANTCSNATSVTKRIKRHKGKESKKQSPNRSKKGAVDAANVATTTAPTTAPTSPAKSVSPSKGKSTLSPASSAIRSLLASKVVQRQQNKLQQQSPTKTYKSKLGEKLHSNSLEDGTYPASEVKVNGIGPETGLEKMEESSASSSLLSSDGSDNSAKAAAPLTSFHGVLHNGQAQNSELKNELMEGVDDPDNIGKNKSNLKGNLLIDLLERRVPSREPVNGMMTGREIRISEKGLELIDKMEDNLGGVVRDGEPVLVNHTNSNSTSSSAGSTCTSNDVQESQKMTFYSSTSDAQVTLQGQASSTACVIPASAVGSVLSGSAVTLASGGGGVGDGTHSLPPSSNSAPLTLRTASGQQVKLCGGKFVRLIEPISGGGASTTATIATAAATVVATPPPPLATIAEVQPSSTATATAFNIIDGDGLVSSCHTAAASCSTVVAAAPPNGDVTYFMSDDTVVGQFVEVVDTVIAETIVNSADGGCGLDIAVAAHGNISNNEVGDGEIAMILDGEGATSNCNINNSSSDTSASNLVESNCSNGGGGDLLEKFSQFSDLIVVPPEQLAGLKRPSSPLPTPTNAPSNNNNNNPSSEGDDLPPPAKKMAMDNTLVESESSASGTIINNNATSLPIPVSVATSAGSASTIVPTIPNSVAMVTANQAMISTATAVVPSTGTTPSLPPGSGAQVVQLPLRLSVNPQNPQQLTFTRQLVLPTGQQLLLSTGNSQSPIQGQMIISKTQGATNDQMPKAIIILQQPQQTTSSGTGVSSQPIVTTASIQNIQTPVSVQQQVSQHQQQSVVMGNTVVAQQQVPRPAVMPPSKPQVVAIQQHATPAAAARLQVPTGSIVQPAQTPIVHQVVNAPLHHATYQQQHQAIHLASNQLHHASHHHHPSAQVHALAAAKQQAVNNVQFEGIHSNSYPHLTQDQLDLEFPFLCEWAGCGLRFLRPQQVSMHALKVHCPQTLIDAVKCEWGQNGCDPLLRKRFSLMTHLQDRHCSKQALEMALYRRKNKIEPPPVPQQPIHHPGYAPNAAFHAIKRHAMSFMSTKEHLHDDNEGPVTKSIRLTSALILRNLVNFSALGRRMLQGYESHLSAIAMSNVESSRTIAQLLHDINDQPKSSK